MGLGGRARWEVELSCGQGEKQVQGRPHSSRPSGALGSAGYWGGGQLLLPEPGFLSHTGLCPTAGQREGQGSWLMGGHVGSLQDGGSRV